MDYLTKLNLLFSNFNTPLTHLYILCVYIYNVKQKQIDMKTSNNNTERTANRVLAVLLIAANVALISLFSFIINTI